MKPKVFRDSNAFVTRNELRLGYKTLQKIQESGVQSGDRVIVSYPRKKGRYKLFKRTFYYFDPNCDCCSSEFRVVR